MTSTNYLKIGAHAHYQDAADYNHRYGRRKEDVTFYVDAIGKRPKRVLELGVGTGRVTLALARAGHHVVALEREEAMLQALKVAATQLPKELRARLQIYKADIRKFKLAQRFDFVISPFNVFMHLYTRQDVEAALACVRRHLKPQGAFVFDVIMPNTWMISRDPAKLYRCGHVTSPKDKRRYQYSESFDYNATAQVQWTTMHYRDALDRTRYFASALAQRQFFPLELEALLHYNGFQIKACYGDFDKSALADESPSQIIVAKRAL